MAMTLKGLRWWLTAVVVLGLIGSGPGRTYLASLDHYNRKGVVQTPSAEPDEFVRRLADHFALMAWFADVAYRHDLPEGVRTEAECTHRRTLGEAAGPASDMPADAHGRWRRWSGPADGTVEPCVSEGGLFFETYVYQRHGDDSISRAVIGFRGTENRKGEMLEDWFSNIAASLGIEPPQYALARQRLPGLLAALDCAAVAGEPCSQASRAKAAARLEILTVGHSLGGGLAQQAGYLSERVKAVYAFNTSPVTNWTHLRLDREVRNEYPTIYRLTHGGEALEKVRFVTTHLTSARHGRYDIGVQFDERSNVGGHAMRVLSCGLANVARAGATSANTTEASTTEIDATGTKTGTMANGVAGTGITSAGEPGSTGTTADGTGVAKAGAAGTGADESSHDRTRVDETVARGAGSGRQLDAGFADSLFRPGGICATRGG